MQIIGVSSPGTGELARVEIGHGDHPRVLLWRQGWVMNRLLSCRMIDGEVVLTARLTRRTPRSRPPRVKQRSIDEGLTLTPGEVPIRNQRVAAYAVVRSELGVLGTECSDRTAVPGLWQLPGGGLDAGEAPAEALVREIGEESDQHVRINQLLDLQSDHWVGRAPNGQLEDFHALRIFFSATCLQPTEPRVIDVDGTTEQAAWIPMWRWRTLPWTSGSRSILDKYASSVPVH